MKPKTYHSRFCLATRNKFELFPDEVQDKKYSIIYSFFSMDLMSGVVLDVGYGIVTCAAMWKGEECPNFVSCDPSEATPTKLADMVHRVASGAIKDAEMETTLKEHVIVTGRYFYLVMPSNLQKLNL